MRGLFLFAVFFFRHMPVQPPGTITWPGNEGQRAITSAILSYCESSSGNCSLSLISRPRRPLTQRRNVLEHS